MRGLLIVPACIASILGFVQWIPALLGLKRWTSDQDQRSMSDKWGYNARDMQVEWLRVRDNPWSLHDWKNINSERVKRDAESGVKVISAVCFVIGISVGAVLGWLL